MPLFGGFLSPKKKKRLPMTHNSFSCLRKCPIHEPTNFPPFAAFFFICIPPEKQRCIAREPKGAHRRFKVVTVLAGKLFDRLPLNHSSDSCFIILRSTSTRVYSGTVAFRLSLSFSLFTSLLYDDRAPSSFRNLSVDTSDRCVDRPGKIVLDIIMRTRAMRTGNVVAN